MEAELLRRLQHTQKMERDAFGELENAMVNAAVPKKHRVNNTFNQTSSKLGSSQAKNGKKAPATNEGGGSSKEQP